MVGSINKIDAGSIKKRLPQNVGDIYSYVSGKIGQSGSSSEFPVSWNSDTGECGSGNCDLLVQIPKDSEQKYGKIVWQVSNVPFETALNPLQAPNVIKVGIIKANWGYTDNSQAYKNGKGNFSYMQFGIDFSTFLPPNTKAKYYVRVVLTDQNNISPVTTPSIPLNVDLSPVGDGKLEIPQIQSSSIYKQPNQDFPGDGSPFGFYFHKNALSASKTTFAGKTTGYKIDGGAELGVRYFNFENLINSDVIRPESRPTLDKVVALLKEKADWKFSVEGHTDNVGGDAFNQTLSEKRAASVVKYLTAAGIDASRLGSKGLGLSKPFAANDSEAGRAQNRRVELVKK